MLGLNAIGLLVVATYTCLTFWLGTLTKQTLIFGNRPFIFQTGINSAALGIDVGKRGGVPISINLGNIGNTAAMRATYSLSFKAFDSPLDKTFQFPDLAPTPAPEGALTVAPKANITSAEVVAPLENLLAMQSHAQYGYVWGWVKYRDQLDPSALHITKFCSQISGASANLTSLKASDTIALSFRLCPFHNCADDDCKPRPAPPGPDDS